MGVGGDAIVTLDSGHQIAQRVTMEGAHVRDILDIQGKKIDWGNVGKGEEGVKGTLRIHRSESLNLWQAIQLRGQGFNVSGGNFVFAGEIDGSLGQEIKKDWAARELEDLYEKDNKVKEVLEKGGERQWFTKPSGERVQMRMNDVTGRNEPFWVVPAGGEVRKREEGLEMKYTIRQALIQQAEGGGLLGREAIKMALRRMRVWWPGLAKEVGGWV